MGSSKKATLIEHFRRIADMVQRLYPNGNGLRFNDEELPTASLPRTTSTEAVLRLATKAWLKANDECDRVVQDKLGVVIWEQDAW